MKHLVQLDSDSRLVWDFFVCKAGDAGAEVDDATFQRWRRIQSEWDGMQREIEALHDANPGTELGDRLPIDDDGEVA